MACAVSDSGIYGLCVAQNFLWEVCSYRMHEKDGHIIVVMYFFDMMLTGCI